VLDQYQPGVHWFGRFHYYHHRTYAFRTRSVKLTLMMPCAHAGLDVTDIGEVHGKPQEIRAKIFVDDEEAPRTEVRLVGDSQAYKMRESIKLWAL
jgi:hypothetical protein